MVGLDVNGKVLYELKTNDKLPYTVFHSNQESSIANFASNVKNIADPDDYFAAFERNALAEKELKKLRGDAISDLKKDNVFRSRRQRRPGLLKRKSSLKHFFNGLTDSAKIVPLSPEMKAHKISSSLKGSPANNYLSSTSQVIGMTDSQVSAAEEQKGFIINKGKRAVNSIDKLLSSHKVPCDQEGVNLLQECLNFKPMVVEKLQLPVTPPDTPPDTPPSIHAETTTKRTPLAAISFLQKQNLQKDNQIDPYTWTSDDEPSTEKPSTSERMEVDVPKSFPTFSMDDICDSSKQNGSNSCLEILKHSDTLDSNINDSPTPSKKISNMNASDILESNTGLNILPKGASLIECSTDIVLAEVDIPKSFPTFSSNDICVSSKQNGHKSCLEILKHSDTLDSNINDSPTPSKKISDKKASDVLESNTEGLDILPNEASLIECSTNKVPAEVVIPKSFPTFSMNDICVSSKQNGHKSCLEILKHSDTLDSNINYSPTPSKKISNLKASDVLESNTEGLDILPNKGSLIECSTNTVPAAVTKTAKEKNHLPFIDNSDTQMFNNAYGPDSIRHLQNVLIDSLAESSELAAITTSSAKEHTFARKLDFGNANSHHDIIEPVTLATSMNDTSVSFRKDKNNPTSEVVLVPPSNLKSNAADPLPPSNTRTKASFNRKSKSPSTEKPENLFREIFLADVVSDTPCCSSSKTENLVGGVHCGGSVGIPTLSKEKDDARIEAIIEREPAIESSHSESVILTQNNNSPGSSVIDTGNDPQMVENAMHQEHEMIDFSSDPPSSVPDISCQAPGHPESSNILGEEQTKENQTSTRDPEVKVPSRRARPKKEKTQRKSLAGCGTTNIGGLRRSTRQRFRPLEHWRGERLLYGRIHQSLATVIGLKYSSPGGNELKVKSFVPPEYAELVERAALH